MTNLSKKDILKIKEILEENNFQGVELYKNTKNEHIIVDGLYQVKWSKLVLNVIINLSTHKIANEYIKITDEEMITIPVHRAGVIKDGRRMIYKIHDSINTELKGVW